VIGRIVTVEGRIEGNIQADEQVILRSSAHVHGDIAAPRVVLEDGARFRGGVDMGEAPEAADRAAGSATIPESRKTVERGRPALESSASTPETSLSTAAKAGATNVAEVAAEVRH
jgi:cytoskeletal protein CcmA (bactofilin family)